MSRIRDRLHHLGAAVVVVPQGRRFGDVDAVVQGEVATRRLPRSVRRLVVAEKRERAIGVTSIEPTETVVGDQVGDVPAARRWCGRDRPVGVAASPGCDSGPAPAGHADGRIRWDRARGRGRDATCANIAVWYPAACGRFGNVSSVSSIGVTSVVTPLTWLYVPVRIDARLGVQIESYRSTNRTASPRWRCDRGSGCR